MAPILLTKAFGAGMVTNKVESDSVRVISVIDSCDTQKYKASKGC